MTTTAPPQTAHFTVLPASTNQAHGIADYAIAFLKRELGSGPDQSVLDRTELFHADSVFCGLSALALKTNAPTVLREEALTYPALPGEAGATVFGSADRLKSEKAIAANSAAVREWDSNGTNFGYNPDLGHTAGEFGHNDFYPVAVAACQELGFDGHTALLAMVCHDEIRGRLAEVFSLKTYKIDHVVHGAIASAAVYGALHAIVGKATADQIESAIGMTVAHSIPWRAIRAGKQLSDSKGSSAAISTEAAIVHMKRSMRGFRGPRDIFRNPEAIFRFFEPTTSGDQRWTELADAPFDLHLAHSGEDFAVMGMHFKLGLYEHQSAGALQGAINLMATNTGIAQNLDSIERIEILAYEPAFGIIGNPAKMDPQTRQSADHSMAYIVSTLIRKASELAASAELPTAGGAHDELWKAAFLSPFDYHNDAIFNDTTRQLMSKIVFTHGGPDYDAKYPDGIPTSIKITAGGEVFDSGFIMYPAGHARNTTADLHDILNNKFAIMADISGLNPESARAQLTGLTSMSAEDVKDLYNLSYTTQEGYE
ncbi:MAG: MmgE/PrpD family protein [Planctomycetota bacterium]